ncbi:hypothetical protein LP52_25445, partial [Streptomonospora alba]
PESAVEVDLSGLYERLAEGGFDYGPAFQGLRRVWAGAEGAVFAEAELPEAVREQAGEFALHPALLDAALHALAFAEVEGVEGGVVPFSWSGVRVYAAGASRVRVGLVPVGGGGVRLAVTDMRGELVAEAERLWLRPAQAVSAARSVPLYRPDWTPA